MRAAVAKGPRAIAVERVDRPEPEAGAVRVRVRACGICGSDLHFFELGLLPPGTTPGHEIAGVVDAVGPGVTTASPGDAVAVEPLHSCGSCPACRAGRDSICREMKLHGLNLPGGFAEYVALPARRIFALPPDLTWSVAALAEPVAVAVHGLRRGGFAPGQRVLVVGAGSVGLLTVLAARVMGASEVILTARHAHQAKLGLELGAARVLDEREASLLGLASLGQTAPIDLAVETVGGAAATLDSCAAAIRPGGTISVLGVFTGRTAVDPFPLLLKEGTLAWSNCYSHAGERADFDDAIRIVDENRDRLARLTTHQLPLDEVERAFAVASDKKAGAVKVTVCA
jgi:threonine dehydrogenase-like Zn-dependent dehydrogenase